MKYKIETLHENRMIKCSFQGFIHDNSIHEVWANLLSAPEFLSMGYKILLDYTQSKINIRLRDVDKIVGRIPYDKNIRGKQLAILVNNPTCTAILMFLRIKLNKNTGIDARIFCTEEAALNWLSVYLEKNGEHAPENNVKKILY